MVVDQSEIPSRLIHGFEAEDWMACLNMANNGRLFNFDLINELETCKPSVRALEIEEMRRGCFDDETTPTRMVTVLKLAAAIRGGGRIIEGAPPYPAREVSQDQCEQILRKADIELRMEEARRKLAPDAPSRLSCLYLAEATPAGRNLVDKIKGVDAFLMEVKIVCALRLGRADAQWLDGVIDNDAIAGYWSGEPRHGDVTWEYLLDGVIESTNHEELALQEWAPEAGVRAHGTQGKIGTPRTPREMRPQKPPR
jgi:hypothetical protein